MSEMQTGNSISNNQMTGTPLYYYGNNTQTPPQQQTVCVTPANGSQIYQYPQTSLYNDPNKQAASGVNIFIYNPSAIGGQTSTGNSVPAAYAAAAAQPTAAIASNDVQAAAPITKTLETEAPAAAAPVSEAEEVNANDNNKKTKRIVELTDNYIKTLESYLRSPDESVRKSGISELVKRYEEDGSRYDDEALTALLNIALQDPDANNRMLAMSPISAGCAHGDENTLELLKNLQSSDKLYGQEAKMASNALIKAAVEETKTVPDYSDNNN